MSPSHSILVVDDEPSILRYMRTLLEVDDYRVSTASSGFEALEQIKNGNAPDLLILDMLMPEMDGLQTLEKLRQLQPGIKVIMLSCVSDTRKVVEAVRLGARDYLTKPFHKPELDAALRRCLDAHPTSSPDNINVKVEELDDDLFFLAASPQMKKIRNQVGLVANVDVPVLLLGESGTGKEVLARLVHKTSPRAHRTFMKVNCAALPADLLESELFGYEAGAFTGANRAKPGKFELCNKGTLLLDEIGEIPTSLQAKLLHVLQDGQFSRLGSRANITVDVRILAATNINMQEAIAAKTFREDLYYRLNTFTLKLPPLRERREEIPVLLKHFMQRLADSYGRPPLPLTQEFIETCMAFPWPGNLRELGSFVKRYLILGDDQMILADLRNKAQTAAASLPAATGSDLKNIARGARDEAEIEAITRALEQTNWNRKNAAMLLNISYKALLYKVRQYGIERPLSNRLRFASRA